MTNLLYSISLILSTNWHALTGLPLEVQLVKKEHTATITYAGVTNSFVLKTEWEALPGVRAGGLTYFTTTNTWQPPAWPWQHFTTTNNLTIPDHSTYTLELPAQP